jgi:hypothetical protein
MNTLTALEEARTFLLWCLVINFGVLAFWGLLYLAARKGWHRLTNALLALSLDRFDGINYASMLLSKVGIFLFNLVPYAALRLVG